MAIKVTINDEARTVTLYLGESEVTVTFTTYRKLMQRGGYSAALTLVPADCQMQTVERT
jgi:hypothetical protein